MTISPLIPATAREAYRRSLLSGDTTAAVQTVTALREQGFSISRIVSELIAPIQQQIGTDWQGAALTIADEHQASVVAEAVVARLADEDTDPAAPPVALFGAEHDQHSLAARLVALVWRNSGWDVRLLAPGMPASEVAAFVDGTGTFLAGVSCALPSNLYGAWRVIRVLRRNRCRVIVGGRGFDRSGGQELAIQMGADGYAEDADRAGHLLHLLAADGRPPGRPDALAGPRAVEAERLHRSKARIVADVVDLVLAQGPWLLIPADSERELGQDSALVFDALASAALLDRQSILTDQLQWYRDRLLAKGVDPDLADLVKDALTQRCPADLVLVRQQLDAAAAA